jgi:hypothetical protein
MMELQNSVDSQKFIQVVKALGSANTYSNLELGYIYHGLDDMGVDPQLFFNYDLNVIIRDISDVLKDFNHERTVDICLELVPDKFESEEDAYGMWDEDLERYLLECDRYRLIDMLNSYLHSGYYLIHPNENKLFEFLKPADE